MAKKFVFNPITGNLDYIDTSSSGGGGGNYNVEKVTLSAANITNKEITLSSSPTTDGLTRLIILTDGGGEQIIDTDFSVTGTTLSWNGLDLDGVLLENDKIVVVYN